MRPAAVRRATCSRLIWLHTLLAVRGVYRCRKERSSKPLRMPSIHPQQSATSSACAPVTVGSPEPFLWIFSQSSVSRAWFLDSQASNAASVLKLLIFLGLGIIGVRHEDARKTARIRRR